MKYFLVATLVTSLLPTQLVQAQSGPDAKAQANGAAALQVQPISVRRSPQRVTPSPYQSGELRNLADSLQPTPASTQQSGLAIPESLVPKQLQKMLLTPPPKPTAIDPLEFFKVPPPESGVKVNVLQN
jgi:hypothetical protein